MEYKRPPARVPDWAWDEYVDLRIQRDALLENEHSGAWLVREVCAIAESIFSDGECSAIWPPIERRMADARLSWTRLQVGLPVGVFDGYRGIAQNLFLEIFKAAQGPDTQDLVPGSTRKKVGRRIAELSRKLRVEIERCRALNDAAFPFEFQVGMGRAIYEYSCAYGASKRKLFESIREVGEDELAHEMVDAEHWIHNSITGDLLGDDESIGCIALKAIENGADEWAASNPALYRPNDPNAHVLYFVRHVTNFFNRDYASPLREVTAALTRCMCGCEMDAATVAKLAP